MAEARGARGAARAAPDSRAPTASAGSGIAEATGAKGAERVDPLGGAPLDPLGGMVVHGGNFGTGEQGGDEESGQGPGSNAGDTEELPAAAPAAGMVAPSDLDDFEKMLLELDTEEGQVQEPQQAPPAAHAAGDDITAAAAVASPAEGKALSPSATPASAGQDGMAAEACPDPAAAAPAKSKSGVAKDVASEPPQAAEEATAPAREVRVDDAHVLRKDVCWLALAERRANLREALRSLRACGEGADGGADVHRLAAGCADEFDGHNKGGRKSEGGRVAHSSAECEAVTAAAVALRSMHLVLEGYGEAIPSKRTPDAAISEYTDAPRASGLRVVSEFPSASIVLSVPTAVGSLPVESILMAEELLALEEGCWAAPEGVEEVSLHVCLSSRAEIQQIVLVVPSANNAGGSGGGGSGGWKAEEGLELRMTVEEHLVHGARSTLDQWQWSVATHLQEKHAGAAPAGAMLCFSLPLPAQGRVLRVHARVAKGQRLRLGRLRVMGSFAVPAFSPPPALVGSSESVARTTLTALLHTRVGAAPLKGVRASLREGGCGGTMGACNGEGLALDLMVEAGTPITGIALELRPLQSTGLPAAAGSAGAAVAAALSTEVGALHSGTPLANQPAEACLLIIGGGGGQVGGRGACDVRLDARLPLVLAPTSLYFALPAPAVAGHVSLLLGRSYGGGWTDKSSLKHLGVQLYSFKLSDA